MRQPAMKLIVSVVTVLLTLMLMGVSPSWAKGPLDGDASAFIEQTISPILIKAKFCSSVQDCDKHDYILYTSWNSIAFNLYGITDEKIIKDILLAMLNSGLRISHFRVWRSKKQDKSFFEKPILEFTDHTEGK